VARVLFLSYHFPPLGGAGVQRPARLVRHLPALGHEAIVVTGPGTVHGRWTPADERLADEIPPGTQVHRIPGPEPAVSTGWASAAERWLGREAPSARWLREGTLEVGRTAARGGVDAVYVWMQPYETAPAAVRLARELGVPLVADLGDPWALDEMMIYPTALHRRGELRRMRTFLAAADAIVMSTPEAARRVQAAFPELAAKPVLAIPNGFEPTDFAGPPPERRDGAFRIVHTGYLHTELGRRQARLAPIRRLLGGAISGVDILARSHIYLLEAVERLLEAEPGLASRLEVHLAGVLSGADREVADRSSVVRLHGFLPHDETIRLMRSADLLFLPMQDLPPGTRATIVPGKTYEYLASGRPILAAVPDGDARDLLAEAGSALLCRPTDVEGIAGAIAQQLRRTQGPVPHPDVVARYEYERLTAALGAIFDELLGARAPDAALV
jgi:glycosyltransferase involved in cell wall biosynthesis